jgi:hypothetical protein
MDMIWFLFGLATVLLIGVLVMSLTGVVSGSARRARHVSGRR